jgi:2-oxoglutarate ferredoxin oxidoreductase subunit beta
MTANDFSGYFPTWCPGCGNFGIWGAVKESFSSLGMKPDSMAIVFGIGCSGNMNDFLKTYGFHALHGRAIPVAIGIRLANHNLPVVVTGGDGDLLGEGGNHFLHGARGNYDLTVLIHNNQVYGLTTGQVSPTSIKGSKSKSTPSGIIEVPINPVALAIIAGATFVAQGFAGDLVQLKDLISQAIAHKGYSVVNIFQPCVTFNKVNTYDWFRQRVYKLDNSYDTSNKIEALKKAFEIEQEKVPLGVLYKVDRTTYEESVKILDEGTLVSQPLRTDLSGILKDFV